MISERLAVLARLCSTALMRSHLSSTAPWVHRILHALSQRGVRTARLWSLTELVRPLPREPTIRLGAGGIRADTADLIGRDLYRGLFERALLDVMDDLVDEGDVVIDVGANIGVVTVAAATLVGSDGGVIALEPAPWLRSRLAANTEEFEAVRLIPCALGSDSGLLSLVRMTNTGASTVRPGAEGLEEVEVPVRTLDEVVDEFGVSRCALLKVDVEGWEAAVLDGGASSIESGRFRSMVIEASPEFGTVTYLERWIRDPGNAVFTIDEPTTWSRLRTRTRLRRLSDVAAVRRQTNVLIIPIDFLARVQHLVITGAPESGTERSRGLVGYAERVQASVRRVFARRPSDR